MVEPAELHYIDHQLHETAKMCNPIAKKTIIITNSACLMALSLCLYHLVSDIRPVIAADNHCMVKDSSSSNGLNGVCKTKVVPIPDKVRIIVNAIGWGLGGRSIKYKSTLSLLLPPPKDVLDHKAFYHLWSLADGDLMHATWAKARRKYERLLADQSCKTPSSRLLWHYIRSLEGCGAFNSTGVQEAAAADKNFSEYTDGIKLKIIQHGSTKILSISYLEPAT